MESWIDWAAGPAFIFALSFMLLGLARHLLLTIWEVVRAMSRAGDKSLPYRQICSATAKWLFPIDKLKNDTLFSVTSILFHIAIIVVPIFLAGHIALLTGALGVWWPAIPNQLADVLTVVAVVTALALVIQRAAASATRMLSRFQDYALPLVIAIPFASGFLVMHPGVNPFPYEATLLVHILSANLVLVLIPVTKLTHVVLLPTVQLVSEVAWHWPPDAGSKLAVTLGKENEPI
jgi:nitrate reductase gamma subunit